MSTRSAESIHLFGPTTEPLAPTPSRGLTTASDLFAFFLGRVETAAAHQGAPVSENTVYYLSNLLAEQGRPDESGAPTTLVELRQAAAAAPRAEAVTLWKRLGDQSLLVTGYFREHLERRRLSRQYVATMGTSAYGVLERLLDGPRGGFGEIFGELAERWQTCANLLAEVRDESAERSDTDIVKLYEEWLATGSPRVAERLRELGVVPVRVAGHS
jgi:hypothetical protein